MARDRMNPWDDENELNQQALGQLLSERQEFDRPANAMPSLDMPVNTTMPIGDSGQRVQGRTITDRETTPAQASVFQGFTPKHPFEGFDWNREQNTGKSAKDAFAYFANQAPPPPAFTQGMTKADHLAALNAWFKQHIEPGMNALGHRITGSGGDSLSFNNWQGQFDDLDWYRGAGAPGGALAWQANPGKAQMPTNPTYQPQGPQTPTPPVQPPSPPIMPGPVNPQGQTDQTALEEVLQEIEALMRGGATPMDARALAQLLGGAS